MKKVFSLPILFILLSCQIFLSAQVPKSIPFQGAARDSSGAVLINRLIGLRFSVLDSSAIGNTIYSESSTTTTSGLGLFTVNVGEGTIISGAFDSIVWERNPKFLLVEIDPNGGTNYVSLGTTQMLSVPYAQYARSSGTQIAFKAKIDTVTMAQNVVKQLRFSQFYYNIGGGLDSNRFIAPQKGLYHFDVSVNWSANNSGSFTTINLNIILNGTLWERRSHNFGSAPSPNVSYSGDFLLEIGDRITFSVSHNTPGNGSMSIIDTNKSIFSGHKIE